MSDLKSHGVPRDVETDGWTLAVHGSVRHPVRLDRDDLTDFPAERFIEDFGCVEGWSANDLSWCGIRVEKILDQSDPIPGSDHALVRSLDGDYACSFPIDRLEEALLAFELDGEPLASKHGGPARLVPTDTDSDCWESIKWVSEIELSESSLDAEATAKETALKRIE
jgi:DMSO/TMAO reductase YedYZ molybdopterin-dependent catalytic subunit